ncbi:hypothetical protein [Kutzneria sp. NPDC051319]|uniref:hypothetical protein n=1 Tax=Kutzneria sp. NPDC051319 TaxID=3155047 RepID=UPI0034122F32
MNGAAEPPAGKTLIRWFIPTEPQFDAIVERPHAFELPENYVRPDHYIGTCGDSFILNDYSRETGDESNRCPVCVRNLRGKS